MSRSFREPNPLRPYYDPPYIDNVTATTRGAPSATSNGIGISAKSLLSSIDYGDYLGVADAPASKDVVSRLLEQAAWKYISVFLAQPFDVAKTLLQVHDAGAVGLEESHSQQNDAQISNRQGDALSTRSDDENSSDSDLDPTSYFTSTAPNAYKSPRHVPKRRYRSRSSPNRRTSPQTLPNSTRQPQYIDLKSSSSLRSAIGAVWQSEGAWGVWKGTNCMYVHSILLSTITSFIQSFSTAILNLPDPGLSHTYTASSAFPGSGALDVLVSSTPLASLFVSVLSAGLTGLLLSPLDIVKTRLILSPITQTPRSIISSLKSLPSLLVPSSLFLPTLLHSSLPTFVSISIPLFVRARLGIDPFITPSLYSVTAFCTQLVELAIKLPLETVLRRGQMDTIARHPASLGQDTVFKIGPYDGLLGTMRSIIYEEGGQKTFTSSISSDSVSLKSRSIQKKGQGLQGLYRGWRVGMWGIMGIWGATIVGGSSSSAGEF